MTMTTDDRYARQRLHARGGFGQVWEARDSQLARSVALKELRPEHEGAAAARARFLEEARITGQLEHPGIVPVYELIEDSGDEIRSPDVNSDDVAHPVPRWPR